MGAFLAAEKTRRSPLLPVILVAAETAMRRGEILGLAARDLHLDGPEPYLVVRRNLGEDGSVGVPKSARSRRRLKLPAGVVPVLRTAKAQWTDGPRRSPQVFTDEAGLPLSPNMVSKAFQRLADAFVRSPEGRAVHAERLTFHGLRHSWISTQLADGVPPTTVAAYVGHANIGVTYSMYTHISDSAPAPRSLYVVPDLAEQGEVA
jgi:integrase